MDNPTQNKVCQRAFLMVTVEFFLLNKPKSIIKANNKTIPKVK